MQQLQPKNKGVKVKINELIKECHSIARANGFWDKTTPFSTKLMLIVTEVAECCEADRKNDQKNIAEELADTCIRIFDLCGGYGIDLEEAIKEKMKVNKNRPYLHNKEY